MYEEEYCHKENFLEFNNHRAESFEDAIKLIEACEDFVFFPLESINSGLEAIANLFKDKLPEGERGYKKVFLRGKETNFPSELKLYLSKFFNEKEANFIDKVLHDSLVTLGRQANILGHRLIEPALLQHFDAKGPHKYNFWHFDGLGAPYGILLPLTPPGTKFCKISHSKKEFYQLSENQQKEMVDFCNQQLECSNFQVNINEAILYSEKKGLHKGPEYASERVIVRLGMA